MNCFILSNVYQNLFQLEYKESELFFKGEQGMKVENSLP